MVNETEFAEAIADLLQCIDSEPYRIIADQLDSAKIRMMAMLSCRVDMNEIIERANAREE